MAAFRARAEARLAGIADSAELRRVRRELMREMRRTLPQATIADVADHIEHVRKVAGVDHVGIGGDFDGIDATPVGLEDVSSYPRLFAELIRRGWTDADLRKLAGENVLRVLREAEAVAARLRQERDPSTRTIEELDGRPGA
jgi:membrane dipeptidase